MKCKDFSSEKKNCRLEGKDLVFGQLELQVRYSSFLILFLGSLFSVELQIYLQRRSVIDLTNSIIWVISVATLIVASVWIDLSGHEQSDEEYDELSAKVYHLIWTTKISNVSRCFNCYVNLIFNLLLVNSCYIVFGLFSLL